MQPALRDAEPRRSSSLQPPERRAYLQIVPCRTGLAARPLPAATARRGAASLVNPAREAMIPTPVAEQGRNAGASLPPGDQRASRRVFTLGLTASALLVRAATFLSVAAASRPGADVRLQDSLPVARPAR